MSDLRINKLNEDECKEVLAKCCGSKKWIEGMIISMPFESRENIFSRSDEVWNSLSMEDWKEAFLHHPKIGDIESLKKKFAGAKELSENEQSGVNNASEDTLRELAKLNNEYEKRFGFIFIVCATGKSAEEMLELIKERINNSPDTEIINARNEQSKITKLRLEKLL